MMMALGSTIAVASSKRLGVLPAVPTFEEAGTPMLASAWYGITLPRETPSDVVQREHRTEQDPEVR
jgi:tripartite-type tricarboxylate transporter receptor subunit TctC